MRLSRVFESIAAIMDLEFRELASEVSHPGESGAAREAAVRRVLCGYLPGRVAVDTGFVIDAKGQESRQLDIVIYDKSITSGFVVSDVRYFPCEAVIAVGEVKSSITSVDAMEDSLAKVESAKALDRSYDGTNELVTGPGISLSTLPKFNHRANFRDQIFGFIFTRTAMTKERTIGCVQSYNSARERHLWPNLFCAYQDYLVSYENAKGLSPSPMDASNLYCTDESERPQLALLFVTILSSFVTAAHVARPNYFTYASISSTMHKDYSLMGDR
jgi:hypothetical protein